MSNENEFIGARSKALQWTYSTCLQ